MPAPTVLLGITSGPKNARLRDQQRDWAGRFNASGCTVRFLLGDSFYAPGGSSANGRDPPAMLVQREAARHADLLFVPAREKLPHVGVVTEKSAAYWATAATTHPEYSWYCKADDDTLVHHERLAITLRRLTERLTTSVGEGAPAYFGHIKWRGWEGGTRFQACGGGWGDAAKTAQDLLRGGIAHGKPYPPCPHAAGPYPYMSGGMVCMNRPLATALAADAHFASFRAVARQRNDGATPCRSSRECAAQPVASHLWHHEDAGVGYNVFHAGATTTSGPPLTIVAVPGHFNDAGIIQRSRSAQDQYWSARAIFVHGIKTREHYEMAVRRWSVRWPPADVHAYCAPCTQPNTNKHNGGWTYARLPCANATGEPGHPPNSPDEPPPPWCEVDVGARFRCCGYPWHVPRYAQIALSELRKKVQGEGRGAALGADEIEAAIGAAAAAAATVVEDPRDGKCGVGGCDRLERMSAKSVQALLDQMADVGEVDAERDAGGGIARVRLARKRRDAEDAGRRHAGRRAPRGGGR